ncbi:MAG: hypothetical protein JWO94_1583 [Verrucomicrobiaceae bacterium]|nr:hypothetical protein [Verrucomicrobiaceae bacterium]
MPFSPVTRYSLLCVAVAALGWTGFHLAGPGSRPPVTTAAGGIAAKEARPPTSTETNPAEVFQRAFWSRPTADDTILHAERREWKDADGVNKWQWFIAVQPSPQLVRRLRTENAFNLVPAGEVPVLNKAPAWFSFGPADVDILKAPLGNMRLMFSKSGNVLYATDAGGGFHTGAPEVLKPVPEHVATGRLPLTPPPNPNKP